MALSYSAWLMIPFSRMSRSDVSSTRTGAGAGPADGGASRRAAGLARSQCWRPREHLPAGQGFLSCPARPAEVVVLHPVLYPGVVAYGRRCERGARRRRRLAAAGRLAVAEGPRIRLEAPTRIRPVGDHIVHAWVGDPRSAKLRSVGEPWVHRRCAPKRSEPQRKRSRRQAHRSLLLQLERRPESEGPPCDLGRTQAGCRASYDGNPRGSRPWARLAVRRFSARPTEIFRPLTASQRQGLRRETSVGAPGTSPAIGSATSG
jgi:hypothetical protein